MVTYSGYEKIIRKTMESGNGHVFAFWNILTDAEKKNLLEDLREVDFGLMEKLFHEKVIMTDDNYSSAPYIKIPDNDRENKIFLEASELGKEFIRKGKAAAFVVAGGQGSRLGYSGPKGKFPVGPVSGMTLFEIFGGKILKYSEKYGTAIPWLIMTSNTNHQETLNYFIEKKFFGLGEKNIFIFPQNMIPSLDAGGKLILKSRSEIFKNPDGHGGSLAAIHSSGALEEMKKRGVEIISYFQVDNPLIKIIDPVFIGHHLMNSAEVSSKAMKKGYPEEKLGVFVKYGNGKTGVIEYSDLPKEKAGQKNSEGELEYSAGSIAIHLFNVSFIEKITSGGGISLPYHRADKKIESFSENGTREIDGIKFEKFVFDSIPLTERSVIYEIKREEEFAPVKNKTGIDSVESAKKLLCGRDRRWLESRKIKIPASAETIEISPLLAVEAGDIPADLIIPDTKEVFLDRIN